MGRDRSERLSRVSLKKSVERGIASSVAAYRPLNRLVLRERNRRRHELAFSVFFENDHCFAVFLTVGIGVEGATFVREFVYLVVGCVGSVGFADLVDHGLFGLAGDTPFENAAAVASSGTSGEREQADRESYRGERFHE